MILAIIQINWCFEYVFRNEDGGRNYNWHGTIILSFIHNKETTTFQNKLIPKFIAIIGNLIKSEIIIQSFPDFLLFSKENPKYKSIVTFVELMSKYIWDFHYTPI